MPGYQGPLGSSVTPETAMVSTMSSMTLQQQSASASNHGGTSGNLASTKGATPALKSTKYSTPKNHLIVDNADDMEDDNIFSSVQDSNAPGLV